MTQNKSWKQRIGAVALTIGLLVGGGIIVGPASPAAAASCTAQSRGGVNPNGSNWVSAKSHLCSGNVQAWARRTLSSGPVLSWGLISTTSTATTGTAGTRSGGGFYNFTGSPSKSANENNIDGVWRNKTFTW